MVSVEGSATYAEGPKLPYSIVTDEPDTAALLRRIVLPFAYGSQGKWALRRGHACGGGTRVGRQIAYGNAGGIAKGSMRVNARIA